MGFLIMILFFGILLFISVKIGNLKNRAKQQILKNTGISSSDINAGIAGSFEKKHLQNFLADYPNFTEESIKDLLKQYTMDMFNKNSINEFSQEVCEKIQKDSKLEKMQTMEFKRVTINYYYGSKLNAVIVYTDNRDEYDVRVNCSIVGETVQLDKYQIAKGAVVGF